MGQHVQPACHACGSSSPGAHTLSLKGTTAMLLWYQGHAHAHAGSATRTNTLAPLASSQQCSSTSTPCSTPCSVCPWARRMALLLPPLMRFTSQGTGSMACSRAGGAACTTCTTQVCAAAAAVSGPEQAAGRSTHVYNLSAAGQACGGSHMKMTCSARIGWLPRSAPTQQHCS
jgi:hypothetical protein